MIYISGAITAKTKKMEMANLKAGRKIAIELCKLGIPHYSPHLSMWGFQHEPDLKEITWQDYINMDYDIISRCSGMLMMDGWEGSKGAVAEHQYAVINCIPVFYAIKQILDYEPGNFAGKYDDIEKANRKIMQLLNVIEKARAGLSVN